MARPRFHTDCDLADLARKLREYALRLLTDGLERGEDRRAWTLNARDETGEVVMTLTLSEAAEGTGLAKLQ